MLFTLEIQYLVFEMDGTSINIKLICEIFASRSIMGVVTPAISSRIRDRTRSKYREGAKGFLLKPDKLKRITARRRECKSNCVNGFNLG